MKKLFLVIIIVLAVISGFWLISRPTTPATQSGLKIVASSWPAYVLSKPVVGDLTLLSGQSPDPHNFVVSPETAKQLSQADILIVQGASLEAWIPNLLQTVANPKLKIIELSEGLPKLMDVRNVYDVKDADSCGRKGGGWNDCGPNDCQLNGGQICPQVCGPGICQIKEEDPHLWLDPISASEEVKKLGEKLTQMTSDPFYSTRALEYAISLASLAKTGTDRLAGVSNRKYIIQHPFLTYLAKRLNLTQLAAFEETPGREPSAKDLSRIASLVKRGKIKSVFVEPGEVEPYIKNFSKELNVKLVVLDPMERGEYVTDYYKKVFESNLNNIVEALK